MNLRNGILSALIVIVSFCQLPQNPRTPDNAGVVHETLSDLPATAAANAVFSCTVSVLYPEYVDSFALYRSTDGRPAERIEGAALDDDTAITLSILFKQPAEYDLAFLLYKTGGVDTIATSVSVFSTTPEVTDLPATAAANAVFPCTVTVLYPEYVDSFALYRSTDGRPAERIEGGALDDDTVIALSIFFKQPAEYDLAFLFYKTSGVDSIVTSVSVFSTTPEVTASTTRQIVQPVDSALFEFQVTDTDSNLAGYRFSGDLFTLDIHEFRASERSRATVALAIPAEDIRALRDTMTVFSMTAADLNGQISVAVLCTVTVHDTLAPLVAAIAPLEDTTYMVASLPDTLRMRVSDEWRIDSVKYGGSRMVFASGDTVEVTLENLDTGTTVDSLEAWDPAGNRSVKTVTLRYEGARVYPPKITPFFQTVNERHQFDTVYLDTKVTITDTAATYGKDSLRWSVVVDSVDSGMTIHFDSLERTLLVSGPPGELYRDRVAVVSVTVTDPSGVTSTQHGNVFIIVEKNDNPVITHAGQSKLYSVPFDTLVLDSCGFDPEGNSRLLWTIDRGTYFYPESLYTISCLQTKIGDGPNPRCFFMFNGKVRIAPDTVAIKTVPATQSVIDTLRFSVKSITAGDTAEVSRYVRYVWSRLSIIPIDTGMVILPPFELE